MLSFLRDKRIFTFIIGISLPVILVLFYNYALFDSFLTTAYSHRLNQDVTNVVTQGFFGVVQPQLNAIYGISFSPEKGYFTYMPIFLLSFYGLYRMFKHKKFVKEALLFLSIFIALFLFNSSLTDPLWNANCSYGPRYLIPTLPFMILPILFTLNIIKPIITYLLSILSIFINFLGPMYGKTLLWTGGCTSKNPLLLYLKTIPERGLTNYTLNLIKFRIYDLPIYLMNLIMITILILLAIILYFIWRKPK